MKTVIGMEQNGRLKCMVKPGIIVLAMAENHGKERECGKWGNQKAV